MNIKDQVVDLEWSQKMEKLGFPQDSLFYWWDIPKDNKYIEKFVPMPALNNSQFTPVYDGEAVYNWEKLSKIADEFKFSAPTVAEMIYMLTRNRKDAIIIPVNIDNVANYLAQEVINEKKREKKN